MNFYSVVVTLAVEPGFTIDGIAHQIQRALQSQIIDVHTVEIFEVTDSNIGPVNLTASGTEE